MKLKRSLAVLAAALMTFSAAACELKDDSSNNSASSGSRQETSAEGSEEVSVSENGADTGTDNAENSTKNGTDTTETGPQTTTYEPDDADTENVKFWDNIILDLSVSSDGNYVPTPDELKPIAECVVDQYNAAVSDDARTYWDKMNMKDVATAEYMDKYLTEEYLETGEMGEAQEDVVFYTVIALMTMGFDDDEDYVDKKAHAEMEKAVKEVSDEDILAVIEGSMWENAHDSDLKEEYPDPEIGAERVYWLELDKCEKVDGALYVEMDMSVICGDRLYVFDEVCGWDRTAEGGGVGAFVPDLFVEDAPEELTGLDVEGIMDSARAEADRYELSTDMSSVNSCAKTFFNDVAEYLADQETKGNSIDRVFGNWDYVKAASPDGLDISGSSSAPGDRQLLETARSFDITEGKIFVGRTGEGDFDIFVQYMSPDGTVGQYPYHTDEDGRAVSAEWGKYEN